MNQIAARSSKTIQLCAGQLGGGSDSLLTNNDREGKGGKTGSDGNTNSTKK